MGDVNGIIDTAGNLIAEYIYDDWGRLSKIQTANDTKEEKEFAKANPLRYRGYYYDNETGYYYLQSRYYDPFTSRFINADAVEIMDYVKDAEDRANAYVYCQNNPVNFSDRFGYYTGIDDIAFMYFIKELVGYLVEGALIGLGIFSGVLLLVGILYLVDDGLHGSNVSESSRKKDRDDALKKIPKKLKTKDGKRVDLSKFKKPIKRKTGWEADNRWRIEKDTAKHVNGDSKWKLFNPRGERIASLGEDGTVLGK